MPVTGKDDAAIKAQLRAKYRELRSQQSREERDRKCALITNAVLALDQVARAKCVYSYVAFPGEVETRELILSLLRSGKTVLAPGPAATLRPQETVEQVIAEGSGFRLEPLAHPDISQVDLFVVPGIVWDKHGYRVGFGSGYFDRLLAVAPALSSSVGLSFDFQVIDHVPHEDWDIPVEVLVTETSVTAAASRR
ncbi:MAG: 5-formyltetrahydrofolate cyclo-ligase [Candidatus Sumerlaeaceae bacterium]